MGATGAGVAAGAELAGALTVTFGRGTLRSDGRAAGAVTLGVLTGVAGTAIVLGRGDGVLELDALE